MARPGGDDDVMSSLLARVSKKLGWDKFNSLQDALQEVEAKTPDWKGGKKQHFFASQDDKENTTSNFPPDKARSYSDGFILQHNSRKNNISKTTSSSNNRHGDKTGLPLESPYFSTTGTSKVQAARKTELPLGDKPRLSNSPSNSLPQKERFVKNSSDSETEDPAPAVKPKVPSVKMRSRSRAEGKTRVSAAEGKSQGRGSSHKLNGKQKMGSLNFSSGSEADTGSSRDQSGASPVLISSDSDEFESFVQKMKTPTSSRQTKPSAASLDDFIVDSNDDSDDDDDVFGPAPLHLSEPVVIATSSSDEDEFQKGIISRFRRPKRASGLRGPKKAGSSRKASRVLSSSSSDDDDLPRLPSWRDNTPLKTNNTPQRKENTPQKKENTPFRKDNTPLRKQVLQKSFLTPQVPPGYRKPALSVPKVSTAANLRTQSSSAAQSDKASPAAARRNSEPTCFLSSLSTPARGKASSSPYVSDFKKHREELVKKLFKLYNETVFDNKLPSDMSVTWNNKMRKTAGFCYTGRSKLNRAQLVARIELSDKVCDSAERVRDTLIHEMCHAATWVLNGVKDGHGRYWQFWARKANQTHPSLPVITRCHTYAINTKFTYQCTECGYRLGRHSKSLDLDRQVCGYCRGRFQLVNKDGTPAKTRPPSKFALFVKERYGTLKRENAGAAHKDVMRLLSAEFAAKNRISSS